MIAVKIEPDIFYKVSQQLPRNGFDVLRTYLYLRMNYGEEAGFFKTASHKSQSNLVKKASSFLKYSPRTFYRHLRILQDLNFVDRMFNSYHLRSITKIRAEWGIRERSVVEVTASDVRNKETFHALAIWKAYVPQQFKRRALYQKPAQQEKKTRNRVKKTNMGKVFKGEFAYSLLAGKLHIGYNKISSSIRVAEKKRWIRCERKKVRVDINARDAALARDFGGLYAYFYKDGVYINYPNRYSINSKLSKRAPITHL